MKALKGLALAMLLVLVAVPFIGAQTVTWKSSFTVVNLSPDDDATVTVTFYDDAGDYFAPNPLLPDNPATPENEEILNPFTLLPETSRIIVMEFVDDLPDGERYAVIVSADQPIVTMANLEGSDTLTFSYHGSYRAGADMGQLIAYLPSVSNAFYDWYSHLSIQNLAGVEMAITVSFYNSGENASTTPVATITEDVPAYATWRLTMDDPGISPALPLDWNGAAIVESAGPLAVINNDYNQNWLPGAEQTYNGLVGGALDLYCPGLYDQFIGKWISSLNVQNVGATTATVTINYSDGQVDNVEIAPNASYLGVYMNGAHDTFFAAHVESTNGQPLVAIANASTEPREGSSVYSAQTYECASAGATELYTPLAMKWFIGRYNTGIQVQNIGTTATDICIEYEGYAAYPECQSGVAANDVVIFNTKFSPALEYKENWSGSARVYSSGNDLVGIVNQNDEDLQDPKEGDSALSFLMFGR